MIAPAGQGGARGRAGSPAPPSAGSLPERRPTDEQKAAIEARSKRTVIVAGAGTGKTFTLVERIAHIIESRGREPECVCAVTFTRNAAIELRERLEARIGSKAGLVTIQTSTSLALAMIRSAWQRLGYSGIPTVYDDDDTRDVIKACAQELGIRAAQKSVLEHIAHVRGYRLAEPYDPKAETVADLYVDRLRRANAVDLAEIIPKACSLAHVDPSTWGRWQWKARYLFVDEYQDTNSDEEDFYDLLDPTELTIVGDPNQEIYAFRGTTNQFLLDEMEREYSQVFYLMQSFRSGSAIVDAANRLIRHNPDQPEKQLRPHLALESGAAATCITVDNADPGSQGWKEAVRACFAAVARRISIDLGGSTAVLARTNRTLDEIEAGLREKRIPYHRLTPDRNWYARSEVRLFHAHIRAGVNRRDEVATNLIISHSSEWTPEDVMRARLESVESDRPLLDCLGWDIGAGCDNGLYDLEALVAHLEVSIAKPFEDEGRTTRASNVRRAAEAVREWIDATESTSATLFLDWLQTREIVARRIRERPSEPVITLATVHGAKGLEWDNVLVLRFQEGEFPHARTESIEEERRLAYVAITRASRLLLACNVDGDGSPSRFLREALGGIDDSSSWTA